MKIYFAHTMSDYGTVYEAESEKWIRYYLEHCNDIKDIDIINPRDIVVPNKFKKLDFNEVMHNIFLPIIHKCDALVAIPAGTYFNRNGADKYTGGVIMEIDYAKRNNIKYIKLPHILSACRREEYFKRIHPLINDGEMHDILDGITKEEMCLWDDIISNIR